MNGINIASLSYHHLPKENIFINLNLQIKRNEITCLVGPNGSGKSTLLKLLAHLLLPQSGHIYLDNKPLNKYPRKALAKKLAFLPQQCALPPSLTVYEYVALARFCDQSWFTFKLSTKDKEFILEAIALTDLNSCIEKPVTTLSAGQKQRARIAFMLVQQAEYLLLDEPMTGLDLKQQRNMVDLLLRLQKNNAKTIILILHDLHQVKEIANTVILLKEGQVVATGSPHDVICNQNLLNAFGCCLEGNERSSSRSVSNG